MWENLEDFEEMDKPMTKITTALSAVIHGLQKFTNYSVQVLAFTNAGDGVASPPLQCLTNEDGNLINDKFSFFFVSKKCFFKYFKNTYN